MARIIRRPMASIDWGTVFNNGSSSNHLGDQRITYKMYRADSGSILVFPEMTAGDMPAQPVIAVMVGFDQSNGGTLNQYQGWVCGYMRANNTRDPATKTYVQDGFSTTPRQVVGPPLYKADAEAFTAAEIDSLSMDIGAAVGPIGPVTNKRWCLATEAYLILVTAEPVVTPAPAYPANGATIDTSSVNFTATLTGHEPAQPTRAVFQVARNSSFSTDVKTFVGDYVAADNVSRYTSVVGQDSYTGLGPGTWYLRVRGRDFRGVESPWSATRSFTISHPALPVPTTQMTGVVPTPYGIRDATLPSVPFGGRKVGVQWRFSKSNLFDSGVVTWTNVSEGRVTPGLISYDPEPNPSIEPGKDGYRVGYNDPSQYLSQGLWYVQVRSVDQWGQTSAWSNSSSFTVQHPPATGGYFPTGGVKFDPETSEVSWDFSDPWPGDRQDTYTITAYDATLSPIWTSGAVSSPISRARLDLPTSHFGETLSWAVQVTDGDGVSSPLSPRQSFLYSRAPQVTLLSPGETVISGQPTVSWSSVFADAGVTQYSSRVTITDISTSSVVYDTQTVIGSQTSVTPLQAVLADSKYYDVRVSVTDTNGLTGTLTLRILTQFVRPPQVPVAISADSYATQGYVTAIWTRGPDPMFVEWRLYRRQAGLEDWTLAATSRDPDARSLRDWLAAGTEVEYAMTQVASRDGSLIESAPVLPPTTTGLVGSSYLLVVPSHDFAVAVKPSGDQFTEGRESHVMRIIGRGDKVNFGTGRSREGSLTVPLRDPATARTDRMSIDALVGSQHEVWLRDPFGDAFRVALREYSFERLGGVGPADLGDLQIPYVEVME